MTFGSAIGPADQVVTDQATVEGTAPPTAAAVARTRITGSVITSLFNTGAGTYTVPVLGQAPDLQYILRTHTISQKIGTVTYPAQNLYLINPDGTTGTMVWAAFANHIQAYPWAMYALPRGHGLRWNAEGISNASAAVVLSLNYDLLTF